MASDGWLKDYTTGWTFRFHRDESSWVRHPYVYIDKGRAMPGRAPALLKTRQYIARQDAIKMWQELLREGWKRCNPQW